MQKEEEKKKQEMINMGFITCLENIFSLVHKLLVENVNRDDAGIYSFVVPIQDISTTGKLTVQSKFSPPFYRCIFES